MSRPARLVTPWERDYSCSTCGARPGQRCKTTRPLHMGPWSARELAQVGRPTSPHQARYKLWLSHQAAS